MRVGNLPLHGITEIELRAIVSKDGYFWRDVVFHSGSDSFSVSAFGDTEADLMTSEEKAEVKLRAGEYADYLEQGDPLGFERGYVPNGDSIQELEAYNRWLAKIEPEIAAAEDFSKAAEQHIAF